MLDQFQAQSLHATRIGVRVAFARLADQGADRLRLAAPHVGDNPRIGLQQLAAEGDQVIGAHSFDSQCLHRFVLRGAVIDHVLKHRLGTRGVEVAPRHTLEQSSQARRSHGQLLNRLTAFIECAKDILLHPIADPFGIGTQGHGLFKVLHERATVINQHVGVIQFEAIGRSEPSP